MRAGILARARALVLAFALALPVLGIAALPANARYAAIVVDADSGQVLFNDHAENTNFPASLTKMMTLYLAFEALGQGRLTFETRLPVSARAASRAPTKLNLGAGQHIAVKDAILGLVTKSANDAATVLAEALGGSESKFAQLMTEEARRLGMRRTVFRNASGLPDRLQVSTARDLAILARALIKRFPQHYDYFATREFSFRGDVHRNHNRLLESYPGVDGLKTGFTIASGFNLAASAVRDGRRLIVVVMGGNTARERDRAVVKLFDRAFGAIARGSNALPQKEPRMAALPLPPARTIPRPVPKPMLADAGIGPAEARLHAAPGLPADLAMADPTTATGDTGGSWAAQVGAFSAQAQAKKAAALAARSVPEYLRKAKIVVESVRTEGGLLHRARFVGLSEDDARSVCAALTKKNLDCIAVPPENLS